MATEVSLINEISGEDISVDSTIIEQAEELVLIIGGADVIDEYNAALDKKIRVYNDRLDKLSSPYKIRSKHTVNGYEYPGRYFYRKVWDSENERIKEVYVGKTVPDDEDVPDGGFPPAPVNELEGFKFRRIQHDILCPVSSYEKYFDFFVDKDVLVLRVKT